jgi:hypothetical protein
MQGEKVLGMINNMLNEFISILDMVSKLISSIKDLIYVVRKKCIIVFYCNN